MECGHIGIESGTWNILNSKGTYIFPILNIFLFVIQKAYQKVYDWQFIFCLEVWTGVICAFNLEADFRPLAYPLTQIIYGVASLVPTARYFPLRMRCIRMLNRIAEATGTFIPVSSLLLDMLEMKELNGHPTGGVGKAIDLLYVKQVKFILLCLPDWWEGNQFHLEYILAGRQDYTKDAFIPRSLLIQFSWRTRWTSVSVELFSGLFRIIIYPTCSVT